MPNTDEMNFRYCIFDIDGTVVDTETTGIRSLMETVRDLMGREMTYEEAYPYFGIPSEKVGGMLGYPDEDLFWHEWEERFMALRHLIVPFEGMLELIADVKKAGAVTGFVTSRSRREMELDPDSALLAKDIDHIVCAGDTARPKPAPDPILRFLELASEDGKCISTKDCIYIGDMASDSLCARSAGVTFALADWRRRGGRDIQHDFIFSGSAGLRSILGLPL